MSSRSLGAMLLFSEGHSPFSLTVAWWEYRLEALGLCFLFLERHSPFSPTVAWWECRHEP
ncbi:MAG: hypothetical protein FWG87_04060 [Defluviitaleaceae bacterium]|nr:hypothetical protein [Defluviitaleaceae bacterium]